MSISASVSFPKKLSTAQMNKYVDSTVYHMAKHTLDYTNNHIPNLTGSMKRDILGYGVKGSNKTYTLGYSSVRYTPYVWAYPQNTKWTNPASYSEWFMTVFKQNKQMILTQAVNQAKKVLK